MTRMGQEETIYDARMPPRPRAMTRAYTSKLSLQCLTSWKLLNNRSGTRPDGYRRHEGARQVRWLGVRAACRPRGGRLRCGAHNPRREARVASGANAEAAPAIVLGCVPVRRALRPAGRGMQAMRRYIHGVGHTPVVS